MIKCAVLGKEFSTKEEMFKELVDNKSKIISLKTSVIKNSEGVDYKPELVSKIINNEVYASKIEKEFGNFKSGSFYPVINTTNIMDSHKDVHFDGIWDKSIPEQKGKVFYAVNHKLEIGKIIAYPKDVEPFTLTVKWRDLGYDVDGETQALIYKVNEDVLDDYANEDARKTIKAKLPAQNSIRMQYVKMELGINSNSPDYKEEKIFYDKHIGKIANREEVAIDGYFFGVSEAKIYKEGSLVLFGSNSVTPVLHAKEPVKSTLDKTDAELEAEKSLQEQNELEEFYTNINL
ncbi:MAG: hypothetical protein ABFS32_20280 [Bacteroidota bacterium]